VNETPNRRRRAFSKNGYRIDYPTASLAVGIRFFEASRIKIKANGRDLKVDPVHSGSPSPQGDGARQAAA
jgi:hypothetical protein